MLTKNLTFVTQGTRKLGVRSTYRRILISQEHRFIFHRIPKAANSTIIKTLLAMDPMIDYGSAGYSDSKAKNKFYLHPWDLSIRDSVSARRNFYYFCFTRNPFDRTLSSYLDKFKEGDKRLLKYRKKTGSDEVPSFDEFVRYLEKGGLHEDIHWIPQTMIIPAPKKISFIGKVEKIENDLRAVTEKIFPGASYKGPVNHNPHSTGASGKREIYYSSDLIRRVARLFRKDLRLLGYGWHN